MATLATQDITTAGLAATYAAATAPATGDRFLPGERTFLHVKNANAGTVVVVLATPGTLDSTLLIDDRTISMATATDRFIAVPDSLYRDPTDGLAKVTCTPNTSVTIAVVRI